ncbi:DUF2029 domain-containing protein [Sphingomonas cannabina]|uniref:DUF2029 domain-containing protein n=1 Tax=Sphingomonas cannabina TaxID=2899123 RepID=UPI001F3BF7F9|nr:DUF2029 domain-containing protein [Sphingomonas cannabina]UIJ46084.1 DUF2029 domain-containing protein [Sphingomonas cannabina]
MRLPPPFALLAVLAVVLIALAWMRPIDHDESQYVAAAVLSAGGLLPYRDYAYLQTPLQPLLFAPIAWAAGTWAYPALRIVNALLGWAAVAGVYAGARVAGARRTIAIACAMLFAACDILLFSAGTARNDALPAAMLAWALPLILKAERGDGSRWGAAAIGLLLAGATAAKISYALPAITYGLYALLRWRRHRPLWVIAGTLPVIAMAMWLFALAPLAALFGTLGFPGQAPAEYYQATGRSWKLSSAIKLLDLLKFLALGPALLAFTLVAPHRRSRLLSWLIVAGVLAALLPTPTWRQYLLPLLPPLFVALAMRWQEQPPGRALRVACAVFAVAGLAPSIGALIQGHGLGTAMAESFAIGRALDAAGARGLVTTLSPQFVPATGRPIDPRFAAGPFYFRSHGLLSAAEEWSQHLVARDHLVVAFVVAPPAAILVGGEGKWTAGEDALDRVLEDWATAHGWRRVPVASARFRLYVPPQAAARRLPSSSSE